MSTKIKKRILFYFMQGKDAGGSDTCLFLLLKYLDKTKYEPFLLYRERSIFVDALDDLNIQLIRLPIGKNNKVNHNRKSIIKKKTKSLNQNKLRFYLGSLKRLIKQMPAILNLTKVIIQNKIDLVHANHYITPDRVVFLASFITGRKIISHNRGYYAPDLIDVKISKYIDQIICMSDYSKSVYTNNGISEKKCKTIYDGIDPEFYVPSNIKTSEIIIGCFGRLDGWKGQQTLIDAAEIIVRTNQNIKFLIVGSGPDENRLKKSVKEKELENHIEFTGYITNVRDYMNKCSVIVHTSIDPEPFGMVIIEAMALEKPVIATNIGGPLEIIDHEIDGFLIPPQKPSILANSIFKLIDDTNLLTQVGKKAREKVNTKFHVKKYAREIENLYEKILN